MTRRTPLLSILALLVCAVSLPAQEWVAIGPSGGDVTIVTADGTTGDLYMVGLPDYYQLGRSDLYRMSREIPVWEPFTHPNGTASPIVTLHARDGELLAALASNHLFHSADGGSSWTPVTIPTVDAGTRLGDLVSLRDTLYFFIDAKERLFRSVSNGRTWSAVEPVDWPVGIDLFYWVDSTGKPINYIDEDLGSPMQILHKGDTIIVLNFEDDLYRSYDRGATWTLYPVKGAYGMALHRDTLWAGTREGTMVMPIDGDAWTMRGALGHDVSGGRFTFAGDRVLAWNHSGVYEWDEASGTFRALNEGRNDHFARRTLIAGDTILLSTSHKLYVSGDGATWEARSTPFNMNVVDLAWSDGRLYLMAGIGLGDSIYLSNDLGLSWRNITTGAAIGVMDGNALYASGGTLIVGGGGGIMRTTNDGEEWERWGITGSREVKSLSGSGDTVFARAARIYRTLDLGSTWHTDDSLTMGRDDEPLAFDNGILYAAENNRSLRRSTDLGATWDRTVRLVPGTDPLDTTRFRIGHLSAYGDTVFAIGQYGLGQTLSPVKIFASVDNGGTWLELAYPPTIVPYSLIPWRDRLLLGTGNRSIHATSVTLDVDDAGTPRAGARIAYDPVGGVVRWSCGAPTSYAIDLYSLTGRHVTTVESGNAEAGEHLTTMPELPGGVYLCTIRTGDGVGGLLVRVE